MSNAATTRSRPLTVLVVALAVAVGAPACSGDGDAVAGQPVTDPCRLLGAAQIATHVNIPPDDRSYTLQPLGPGTPPSIGVIGMRYCRFQHRGRAVFVEVGLAPKALSGKVLEKWEEQQRVNNARLTRLPGLGEEAVWSTLGTLVVVHRRGILGVWIGMALDTRNQRERARRLAVLALARL